MTANPFGSGPTFVDHTGIEITSASADLTEGSLLINENHHQPYGVVHGGVYCAMIETLASTGAAIWALEQGMAGAVGLSNKTDFIRATSGGVLLGRAVPIHRGRNQQLWQVDLTRQDDSKLAAHGEVRLQNVTNLDF